MHLATGRTHLEAEREIDRLRKLLDSCRESMRVSMRFHGKSGTDWSDMIDAIDAAIGQKE